MLPQLIGRVIAEHTGISGGARAAGERAGLTARFKAWGAHVDRHLAQAPDRATARRMLAGEWARVVADFAALAAPRGTAGDTARVQGRWAGVRFATLSDPRFDELPLIAAGLTARDGAWYGTADAVAEAREAAELRGLSGVDSGGAVELARDGAVVARLRIDRDVVRGPGPLALPKARGPLAWGLTAAAGFLGVMIGLMLLRPHPLAAVVVMIAPVTVVLGVRGLLASLASRRWHAATLVRAEGGAPYRDGGDAHASAIPLADALDRLRAAGFAPRAAGATLQVEGDVAMTCQGDALPPRIAARYRELVPLVKAASALGASRVEVTFGEVAAPALADWETWRARHGEDESARADDLQAFRAARARAIAAL